MFIRPTFSSAALIALSLRASKACLSLLSGMLLTQPSGPLMDLTPLHLWHDSEEPSHPAMEAVAHLILSLPWSLPPAALAGSHCPWVLDGVLPKAVSVGGSETPANFLCPGLANVVFGHLIPFVAGNPTFTNGMKKRWLEHWSLVWMNEWMNLPDSGSCSSPWCHLDALCPPLAARLLPCPCSETQISPPAPSLGHFTPSHYFSCVSSCLKE